MRWVNQFAKQVLINEDHLIDIKIIFLSMLADRSESPQLTIKMIECGSLALDRIVQHGICLFGDTKVGKTTSAHYLTRATLIGVHDDVEGTKYKVQTCDARNVRAIIGLTRHSQTQIPNQFSLSGFEGMTQNDIVLFDCPGYSDSYGCGRIISNGYFHYRLFSKIKKIKFVLVFSFDEMKGQAKDFTKTFQNFINGFSESQLEKQYKNIFAATSVLITKAPLNKQDKQIQNVFKQVPTLVRRRQFITYFDEMKKQVLQKQRLFILKEAKEGQISDINNMDIVKIDTRSKFWEREIVADNMPDMKMIKTNIQELITTNYDRDQAFKADFKVFGQYFQTIFNDKFNHIRTVLTDFIEDTFNPAQGGKFSYIESVKQAVSKQEQKISKLKGQKEIVDGVQVQNRVYTIDGNYEVKKREARNAIYAEAINNSQSSSRRQCPSWLKRIKVAEIIYEFSKTFASDAVDELREVEYLQVLAKKLMEVIKEIIGLNRDHENQETMKKFGYFIHELLEMSNVFYRIMYKPEGSINSAIAQEHPLNVIIVRYPTKLTEIAQDLFKEDINKIKVKHFEKLKNQQLGDYNSNAEQNKEVINYLDEILNKIKYDEEDQKIIDDISIKQNTIILNQAQKNIKKINRNLPKQEQIQDILRSLNDMRLNVEDQLVRKRRQGLECEEATFQSIKMLDYMAQCLVLLEKEQTALSIWERIFLGGKIFQVLDDLEKTKAVTFRTDHKRHFDFLLKYMHLARRLGRFQLAMKKAQEALDIAYNLKQLSRVNEVRLFISTIIYDQGNTWVNRKHYYELAQWLDCGIYDLQLPPEITDVINRCLL